MEEWEGVLDFFIWKSGFIELDGLKWRRKKKEGRGAETWEPPCVQGGWNGLARRGLECAHLKILEPVGGCGRKTCQPVGARGRKTCQPLGAPLELRWNESILTPLDRVHWNPLCTESIPSPVDGGDSSARNASAVSPRNPNAQCGRGCWRYGVVAVTSRSESRHGEGDRGGSGNFFF